MGDQVLALASDSHPTANAIEEPDAEVLLELANLPPEGGLAYPEPGGGLRESSGVGHGHEVAEVPEVHGAIIPLRHRSKSR